MKIDSCAKCGTYVPHINMNCPNCGWWFGFYKFTKTEEYQKEFGPNRKKSD